MFKPGRTFEKLTAQLIQQTQGDESLSALNNTNLIIVHHLLPTHLFFFSYLIKIYKTVVFIAIPYSLDSTAKAMLAQHNVIIETPPTLPDLENTLNNWVTDFAQRGDELFSIFEVGGYSCSVLGNNSALLRGRLVGVVEDTEKGIRIHESYLEKKEMWWKVFSVARSPLKVAEDALTADAVIYSLERQVRILFDTLNFKNILVLGFGKVGKHIALSLKDRKANVFVYDIDPFKTLEAYALGFVLKERQELLQTADIIIGATGETSIKSVDFELLKDGVFLASASSRRIEFELSYLENHLKEHNKINERVDCYTLKSNRNIYLINSGEPINFIDLGIIGFLLELVWIECVFCLLELRRMVEVKEAGVFELSRDIRSRIAENWMKSIFATHPDAFQTPHQTP